MAAPTAEDVAAFLGRPDDERLVESLERHLPIVITMVRAYTRGRGFDAGTGEPTEDLAAVVTTAAARLAGNPAQLERKHVSVAEQVTLIEVCGFAGWTLPELAVLHRYRRRAA